MFLRHMISTSVLGCLLSALVLPGVQPFVLAPQTSFQPSTKSQTRNFLSAHLSATTTDYLQAVEEGILEAGLIEEWEESCQALAESVTSLSREQAQDALASALGWKSWGLTKSKIARKYIKPKPPISKDIVQAIEWLKTGPLQLSDEELGESIVSSPAAYLLSPEKSYESAMKAAPSEYKDAAVFHDLVRRYPAALGNSYNCVNDGCNSECGNCWVSFKNRLRNQYTPSLF